jgi:hypothetical protein
LGQITGGSVKRDEASGNVDGELIRNLGEQIESIRRVLEVLKNRVICQSALLSLVLAEAVRENSDPAETLSRLEARMSQIAEKAQDSAVLKLQPDITTSVKVVAVANLKRDFARAIVSARNELGIPTA